MVASPQVTAPADRPETPQRLREHEQALERVKQAYAALPPDLPVRLAKRTSNLFRTRSATDAPRLDLSALRGVIQVRPGVDGGPASALVGGLTTYEQLVDELLPHGYVP